MVLGICIVLTFLAQNQKAKAGESLYCTPDVGQEHISEFWITGKKEAVGSEYVWVKIHYRTKKGANTEHSLKVLQHRSLMEKFYKGQAVSKTIKVPGTDSEEGYSVRLEFPEAAAKTEVKKGNISIENLDVAIDSPERKISLPVSCHQPKSLNCAIMSKDPKYSSLNLTVLSPKKDSYRLEAQFYGLSEENTANYSFPVSKEQLEHFKAGKLVRTMSVNKATTFAELQTGNKWMNIIFNQTSASGDKAVEGLKLGEVLLMNNRKIAKRFKVGCAPSDDVFKK